jgi:hypothetical protein
MFSWGHDRPSAKDCLFPSIFILWCPDGMSKRQTANFRRT